MKKHSTIQLKVRHVFLDIRHCLATQKFIPNALRIIVFISLACTVNLQANASSGENHDLFLESPTATVKLHAPANIGIAQFIVRGKVTDSLGNPLTGVSVSLKGSSNGTVTNSDGDYSLTLENGTGILVFSFIGYKTMEVPVNGRSTINVRLTVSTTGLNQLVVVGYGTQKKVDLTGAVATVSSEAFENRTMPNPVAALQGEVPGMTVTRTSGQPGAENYQMQIRGFSSVNNVNVLVMVDGVKSSFSAVNPKDIASISVLKDAAAAAIYGSDAAGGVILITTKKGEKGKVRVSYSGSYGFTHAARMPHRMKTWEEAKEMDIARVNSGTPIAWGPVKQAWMQGKDYDVIDTAGIRSGVRPSDFFPGNPFVVDPTRPNVWLSYGNYDQIEIALQKDNPIQSHNISLSGGGDKTSYYFSAGYYDREGILRYAKDKEDRYNLRLNLTNRFSDKISLNSSVSYTNRNVYRPVSTGLMITRAYKLWGWIAPYLPNGDYHIGNGIWINPIQQQKEEGNNDSKAYTFEGQGNLAIADLLPGLDVNIVGSKQIETGKSFAFRRTIKNMGAAGQPVVFNPTNTMSKSSSFTNYNSFQAYATYSWQLAGSHHFKLLGGYSYEDFRYEYLSSGISNLVTNDFYSLNWGDPKTTTTGDNILTSASMGFFGRLNYNFNDKYLFEANLRYDGSSRLAPENRWQLFPSLSAGWVIGNEKFFPENNVVNNLKIRASWGQLGNSSALGYYDYIGMLNSADDIPFNDQRNTRIYQSELASPEKTWEIVQTANVGMDIFLLNSRLTVTGNYYVKKNKNMLAQVQVPSIIGVGLSTYNVGELKTNGWEIDLKWKDNIRDFRYWISANLSDNHNKLIKYAGVNAVYGGMVPLIEGMPLNTIWGYKTDGLFQSNEAYKDYGVFISAKTGQGDMKYLDLNNDKKIDGGSGSLAEHGDLVLLGDDNPRYLFGVNMGFEWKGFNFSCLFQGVGKRSFFLNNVEFVPVYAAAKMPFAEQSDYWTPENPDAFWPRPYQNSDHSYWPSDYWVQDGSYIRLKNIVIGYTIPQSLTQKIDVSKANIYISGQNVYEWTKAFSFIDPEYVNNAGNVYPFYRTFQVGLNLTF